MSIESTPRHCSFKKGRPSRSKNFNRNSTRKEKRATESQEAHTNDYHQMNNSDLPSRSKRFFYVHGIDHVDGNFTPLLGCDACLDLEVLEFVNLELITTPGSKQPEQDCFVINLASFLTKYIWKLIR